MNSINLKDRILAYFPDLQAHKEGRDIFLVFNKDVGPAIRKACEHDADTDAIHLARAANIVRREIFNKESSFTGTYDSQCQASSVNMLKPGTACTFSDYASEVFLPHVMKQLQNVQRLDVMWDEYVNGSLMTYTCSTRCKGSRRHVESSNAVAKNWMEVLRNDDNKTELFSFLSMKTANLETEGQIIVTHHKDVLCTQPRNTTGLAPCTHEEADTTMFLHVSDAVNHGYGRVLLILMC